MLSYGGTGFNHSVGIWRSKNVFGPYEMHHKNPIATHRDFPHDHPIHCIGHADLVQTQNNEWWMVLLGTRPYGGDFYNLGRETFMVPVDWSDEWPVVNPKGQHGRVRAIHRRPNLPVHEWDKEPARDDFNSERLNPNFNFIRTPCGDWWKIDKKRQQLEIKLIPQKLTETLNPAFIGRRQQHQNFTAITKMEFSPQSDNETAGLALIRDTKYQFRMEYTIKRGKNILQLVRVAEKDGEENVISTAHVDAKVLYLKASALGQLYSFAYSTNGKTWHALNNDVDGRILSRKWAGGFTGIFIGMYASSNGQQSNNTAKFDWFEYSGF